LTPAIKEGTRHLSSLAEWGLNIFTQIQFSVTTAIHFATLGVMCGNFHYSHLMCRNPFIHIA